MNQIPPPQGGGDPSPVKNYDKLSKDKKEKFIKLILKIKEKIISQTKVKKSKKYKITVEDINLVANDILKTNINIITK